MKNSMKNKEKKHQKKIKISDESLKIILQKNLPYLKLTLIDAININDIFEYAEAKEIALANQDEDSMSENEKEELLDLLFDGGSLNKDYYLESLFIGKTDARILTDDKIIDKLIRTIKYNHYDSTLVERIIEELSY